MLIVEDDRPERMALSDHFTEEGYHVINTVNGDEGLVVAENAHPDLILLDILMPSVNGLVMKRRLREKNAWGKNVPVVIITNLGCHDEIITKDIVENEPTYCITKSDWSIEDIAKKVKKILSKS